MSSVTTSRDSVKARLAKQRSGATEPKMANTKRSQPATRSPGTASTKAKSKWSSSTSVNTSVSDITSSTNVANSTSLSESSSTLDGRSSRLHRPTRKAPLPAVARQSTVKRNLAQRRAAAKKPAVQPDDGWEADMEDAEPADDAPQPDMDVNEVKTTSTYQSSPVTPVPDKVRRGYISSLCQRAGSRCNRFSQWAVHCHPQRKQIVTVNYGCSYCKLNVYFRTWTRTPTTECLVNCGAGMWQHSWAHCVNSLVPNIAEGAPLHSTPCSLLS